MSHPTWVAWAEVYGLMIYYCSPIRHTSPWAALIKKSPFKIDGRSFPNFNVRSDLIISSNEMRNPNLSLSLSSLQFLYMYVDSAALPVLVLLSSQSMWFNCLVLIVSLLSTSDLCVLCMLRLWLCFICRVYVEVHDFYFFN